MRKSGKSIQKDLLFYFCVLIFAAVIVLAVILSANTSQVILEYTKEEITEGLEQIEKNVEDRLKQSTECFSSIILNNNIRKVLEGKQDIDSSEGFEKAHEVSKTLWLLKKSYPYVSAIYIYDVQNQYFYHSENTIIYEMNFENTELYEKCIYDENYYLWEVVQNIPGLPVENEKGYLTCALPMKENVTKKILGYIFISIDVEKIFDYIREVEIINSGEVFLITKDNQLLESSIEMPQVVLDTIKRQENQLEETEIYLNSISRYLYVRESENTGLKYGILIPYRNIYSSVYRTWILAFICMIPILGMAFCLSYIFSKKMYQPIQTLVEHMKKSVIVEKKKKLIEEKRDDEFGILYMSFNHMLIENEKLMKELSDEQEKQKLIQLRLFQEQINPHFLYNTLNSIYCLSNLYNVKEIADLSEALTNFYRLSLNKGQEMITIQDTLYHIQYYIRIQNLRYRGRYRLEVNVEEKLMDIMIPELIVQPLVENAIEHGLKDTKYSPIIWLDIHREEEWIKISVTDKGCGINSEKQRVITQLLESDIEKAQEVFALKNIHDRLKLYYGENSRLNIYSESGKGTKVEIMILVKCEEE